MADEWVVIEHADGRRFSVTRASHASLYADFEIVGEETPADFDVSVPLPRAKRSHARKKAAAPIAETNPAENDE